ncbi:hypothetical protein [Pseudoalteromonas sp. G4]|uniref:hypothetical protein n=1 Tax=Pseudoalteromonas sp. G4 TaxID=2992761 RepID=UPI00237E0AFF|nr:hypothetical protein [Pseudoalteromonas sp. G4]MDE3272460.1 hypothetical protein [Pseudoalteromonas sp. G4]
MNLLKLIMLLPLFILVSACSSTSSLSIYNQNNISYSEYYLTDLSIVHQRVYPNYTVIEFVDFSTNENEMAKKAVALGADLVLRSINNVSGGSTYMSGVNITSSYSGDMKATPSYSTLPSSTTSGYVFLKKQESAAESTKLSEVDLEFINFRKEIYSQVGLYNRMLHGNSFVVATDADFMYIIKSDYNGKPISKKPEIKVSRSTGMGIGMEVVSGEPTPVSVAMASEEYGVYSFKNDAALTGTGVILKIKTNGRRIN